jgi:hypothetical protein
MRRIVIEIFSENDRDYGLDIADIVQSVEENLLPYDRVVVLVDEDI